MKLKINVIGGFLLLILTLIPHLIAGEKNLMTRTVSSDSQESRYSRFSRGINLPFWFWMNKGKLQSLEERFSIDDLHLIKALGLTFVRIPVDMANIYDPEREDRLNPESTNLLLEGISLIIQSGLAVNFDLHSISQEEGGSDYSSRLERDPVFVEEFILFWEKLAEKLAIFDPQWLLIEPMNEPVFLGEEKKWPPIQARLIAAIRKKLPEHTILATGANWSNLSVFLTLEPLQDKNIWYNFHFYEPHIFTHQGATWSSEWLKSLREVPYPSSPEAVREAISLAKGEDLRNYLRQYGQQHWDRLKIEAEIKKAAEWGKKYGVRLFCNEFGAYRLYCLPIYRKAWIQDVRTALEKYGIHWAMWEFDGTFGLVRRIKGKAVVDKDIAAALGLIINHQF